MATAAPTEKHAASLAFMPQLDGLRAIAVLAVMVHHFGLGSAFRWASAVDWGFLGVRLFFVLSGFLITGILLRNRARREGCRAELRRYALHSFYPRRFLRLFPCFYFMLAVAVVLGIPPVRQTLAWHAAYLSNVYFALTGSWNGSASHFWSLAVEEQFYLAWPWAVLFLPRRWLLRASICLALIGPAFRVAGYLLHWNALVPVVLTPACLDSLGIGAVLACVEFGGERHLRERFLSTARWFWIPLLLLVALDARGSAPHAITAVLSPSIASVCFVWLVARAAAGFNGWVGASLANPVALHLGKVSYGIYVYHLFCPWFLQHFLARLDEPRLLHSPLFTPGCYVLAIAIASCSWWIIEKPIQGLKASL